MVIEFAQVEEALDVAREGGDRPGQGGLLEFPAMLFGPFRCRRDHCLQQRAIEAGLLEEPVNISILRFRGKFGGVAAGHERRHLEAIGMLQQHVCGGFADRAGGTQNRYALDHNHIVLALGGRQPCAEQGQSDQHRNGYEPVEAVHYAAMARDEMA